MSKNPHRVEEKQRRELRRRNHIARDLWVPEFRQRRIERKRDKYGWKDRIDEEFSNEDLQE
jgi:hypothetical protein